jgi:hypothetical protein
MAYRRAEASTTADSALVHKKSEWKVEVGSNNFRRGVNMPRVIEPKNGGVLSSYARVNAHLNVAQTKRNPLRFKTQLHP